MRRTAPLLLLATLTAALAVAPAELVPDMDRHVVQAVRHLRRVPAHDRHFVRFLSWLAVPSARLTSAQKVMRWWLNQLSTDPDVAQVEAVAGSGGTLWAIDLRDFRWNAAAWREVARREPYFREPWVMHEAAALLRVRVGEDAHEEKDGTVHVIAVVRADWLFRDSIESARSTTYYDLLFAGQRFVRGKKIDFPKDEADWNAFFGIDVTAKHLAKLKIDVRKGAITAGSNDDPVNGSIVARNNRVIQITRGPFGVAMKTFDVRVTAGDRDFIESAPDVAVGKIAFDAGELLAALPNGGQAGLLIDGKAKRIEFATGDFVHPRSADGRTPDVRTMMSCVVCHAPDGGLIPPRDTFADLLRSGVELKIKDRKVRNRTRAFFLNWEDEIAGHQRPYLKLLRLTAGVKAAELPAAFLALRDGYDDPVTPEQAAREAGVGLHAFKAAAARSVKARLGQLAAGVPIPRAAWERGAFREALLLLAAKVR